MIYLVQKFAGHEWHPETSSAYRLIAQNYIDQMTVECGGHYRILEVDSLDLPDFKPREYVSEHGRI